MKRAEPCSLLFQDGTGEEPYAGDDRRKKTRPDISKEARTIINEIDAKISRKIHDCIIPGTLKPHLEHISLAITEIGEGSIPRGINTSKTLLIRIKEFFKIQDKSKSTAINAAIRWIVPFLLSLIAAGIYIKAKGG